MINFRVIKIGDLIKNLVKIVILISVITIFTRFLNFVSKIDFISLIENKKCELKNKTFIECLDENLEFQYFEKETKNENIISRELGSVILSSKNQKKIKKNEIQADEKNEVSEKIVTEIVEENNKKDVYNFEFETVKIRNQTSINLTNKMVNPDIDFNKNKILIFHTHTSESYTQSENYNYNPSGNYRTLDNRCNVIGVGNELEKLLKQKDIEVIHNKTFHDYPEYNGAYTRSLNTVEKILKEQSDIDLVIDLHRDAIGDSAYAPSVMIGEKKVAQLMIVLGSNEGGLPHEGWNDNLKVAVAIQKKANEMYPGLFKPILLTKYRYNEHVTKGACIIEVGATGNTMEEVLGSMEYLSEVISKL